MSQIRQPAAHAYEAHRGPRRAESTRIPEILGPQRNKCFPKTKKCFLSSGWVYILYQGMKNCAISFSLFALASRMLRPKFVAVRLSIQSLLLESSVSFDHLYDVTVVP